MSERPVAEYLLDTNVVSELARPQPQPSVVARLAEVEALCTIASITWHELRFGVDRLAPGRRRDALEAFLADLGSRFPVLPHDRAAASWHARERARLAGAGRSPAFADGQIAAIAVTRDVRLVTRNPADFAGFDGLTIDCWWPSAR